MKHLLALLALFLCVASCIPPTDELASTKDFVASPDQDTARHIPLYIHQIPVESRIDSSLTSVGGFGQVIEPPISRPEAQALCNSYWVVQGYMDSHASRAQRKAATGQWIQCLPNGTFRGGHWDKQTHAGAWHLTFKEKFPLLQLDSNVDRMDATWEIQGFSGDQARMSVVRRNTFGPHHNSISSLWVELYDRPTREQFKDVHQGL
jgi:hypothetical protein